MALGKEPLAVIVLIFGKSSMNFIQMILHSTLCMFPAEEKNRVGDRKKEGSIPLQSTWVLPLGCLKRKPLPWNRDRPWVTEPLPWNQDLSWWPNRPGSPRSTESRGEVIRRASGTARLPQWPWNQGPGLKCFLLRCSPFTRPAQFSQIPFWVLCSRTYRRSLSPSVSIYSPVAF